MCKNVANVINANSVGYVSVEGLIKAIGLGERNLCLGCLNKGYPVPISGERVRGQQKIC